MPRKKAAPPAYAAPPVDDSAGADPGPTPPAAPPDTAADFDPAALERPAASAAEPTRPKGPGRGWAERYTQPVAYRRFTLKDERGAEKILFAFQPPPGQTKPPEEVIEVMRDHKFWREGKPYGLAEDTRTNDESYTTGLGFGSNPKHPKAWVLPNTELGRAVADSIDQALDGVAERLDGRADGQGR